MRINDMHASIYYYYYYYYYYNLIMQHTVLTVHLGTVTISFLKPQEPFGEFEQCVGRQFSATVLSEFQYLFPLSNFLTLWVLFLGQLSLMV